MIRLLFKVSGRAHRGLMALQKKPHQPVGEAKRSAPVTAENGGSRRGGETIFCLTGTAAALSDIKKAARRGRHGKGKDESLTPWPRQISDPRNAGAKVRCDVRHLDVRNVPCGSRTQGLQTTWAVHQRGTEARFRVSL